MSRAPASVRSVTFDTNIYVSALQFGGSAEILFDMAIDGEIEVAISKPIIDETVRILRDKFGWRQPQLVKALVAINSFTRLVKPTVQLAVVPSDPDDNRIVECAVSGGSEAIVTGDTTY